MLHVYGAKAESLWTSNIFLNLAFAYLAGAGQENSNLYYRYIMLHSKNGLNLGPPPPFRSNTIVPKTPHPPGENILDPRMLIIVFLHLLISFL